MEEIYDKFNILTFVDPTIVNQNLDIEVRFLC
jgi:hypothetical protein